MEYNTQKISMNLKRKKIINNIIKFIFSIILIFLFIINAILLYYNLNGENTPNIFSIYVFNIVSGSMEPVFYENDLIVVKKYNQEKLKIGDIITYQKDGAIISHKIVNIEENSGERFFRTKGENNELLDNYIVTKDEIYGKVLFKITKLGIIVDNKYNFIKFIILIIIIFLLYMLNNNKKCKRKIIRKKYEIKKTRDNYNILDK